MDQQTASQAVRTVLDFWFDELEPAQWFEKDPALDAACIERFQDLYDALAGGLPPVWPRTADGLLAAVIVLDQLPRNMFRGDPRSFATDAAALALADEAIAGGLDARLEPARRGVLYMPFQHSEDRAVQARSVALFDALDNPRTADFAARHKAIVDRFGRFPHRNAVLGRPSTAAETAFLEEPDSSF